MKERKYRCSRCPRKINESRREAHAQMHGAMPGPPVTYTRAKKTKRRKKLKDSDHQVEMFEVHGYD